MLTETAQTLTFVAARFYKIYIGLRETIPAYTHIFRVSAQFKHTNAEKVDENYLLKFSQQKK